MSIQVVYECDGCNANAKAKHRPRRHFQSISGRSYGFGSYRFDGFDDIAPDGWVPFDPYTGCCYCPECWAAIDADLGGQE